MLDTKLKYVRLKSYDEIIIFPSIIEHSDFSRFEPVSAGFCYVGDNKVDCYGSSYSLKLDSKPKEDSLLATKQLFGFEAFMKYSEILDEKEQDIE